MLLTSENQFLSSSNTEAAPQKAERGSRQRDSGAQQTPTSGHMMVAVGRSGARLSQPPPRSSGACQCTPE